MKSIYAVMIALALLSSGQMSSSGPYDGRTAVDDDGTIIETIDEI